mmetsp:Transcript_34070/g.98150  ORF Transcript_34070/g.98150 Transcript_34070/m.98150 type:complete len:210 (-) Transcript_34070:472-1101(-)
MVLCGLLFDDAHVDGVGMGGRGSEDGRGRGGAASRTHSSQILLLLLLLVVIVIVIEIVIESPGLPLLQGVVGREGDGWHVYVVVYSGAQLARIDSEGVGAPLPLADTHHSIYFFEAVVAQTDDQKLSRTRLHLDVFGDARDVGLVEGGVDLVHEVDGGRLVVVQRKDKRQGAERLLATGEVLYRLPRLLVRPYAEVDALLEGVIRHHWL